jgi:hypothetical protein
MATKCFMCGAAITRGILCEKCDKPRAKGKPADKPLAAELLPEVIAEEAPPYQVAEASSVPLASNTPMASSATLAGNNSAPLTEATAPALDPFPKAPILPFPLESATPAITSVANVLIAAGVAGVVVGPDRSVKFVTEDAKRLFNVSQSELSNLKQIEALADVRFGDLSMPSTMATRVLNRNYLVSLVPLTGGASGAVLVFRHADTSGDAHARRFLRRCAPCASRCRPRGKRIHSSLTPRPPSTRSSRRWRWRPKSKSRRPRAASRR